MLHLEPLNWMAKLNATFSLKKSKTVAEEKACLNGGKFTVAVLSTGFDNSFFGAPNFEAGLSGELERAGLADICRTTAGGCADSGWPLFYTKIGSHTALVAVSGPATRVSQKVSPVVTRAG